jgi:hypothetical protein
MEAVVVTSQTSEEVVLTWQLSGSMWMKILKKRK